MKYILLIGSMALGISLGAQAQNLQLKAEMMYRKEAYPNAAKLFEQSLSAGNRAEVLPKLADCYRRVSNTMEAEKWYAQISEKDQTAPDVLRYAQVLKANGKYAEAAKAFDRYGELSKDWAESRKWAEECENAAVLKGTGEGWEIKPTNVKEGYSEFGPVLLGNKLYYSAARPRGFFTRLTNARNNNVFYDVYSAERTQPTQYGKPVLVRGALRSAYHDGPLCFSPDGQTVYFTRSNVQKGKLKRDGEDRAQLQLLEAKWNGKKFMDAALLPFNSDQFSTGHPTLSPDGKWMVFASNRPGGQGGTDLWKVEKKGNEWGQPVNLGPEVNSKMEELFPSFAPDGSLFFASNGHPGLGGLDIFWSGKAEGGWSAPMNVGVPINSSQDDFSMYWERNGAGLFSSNRPGGGGEDDLLFFRKSVPVQVKVVDARTGEALPNVAVTLASTSGQEMRFVTDNNGQFSMIGDWKRQYKLKLSLDKYEDVTEILNTEGAPLAGKLEVKVKMVHVPVIQVAGNVKDELTGAAVPMAQLKWAEGTDNHITQVISTDAQGVFQEPLTEGSNRWVLVGAEGYFNIRKPFVEPVSRERDTTVSVQYSLLPKKVGAVLQIIYYDYNASNLRDRSKEDLDKLLTFLQDNPDAIVELGSHTDSRGSLEYNTQLSAERAEAARAYLIQKGIPEAQISAKGYGETVPANQCRDDVPCTEEEYSKNRRTEIVLKEVGK